MNQRQTASISKNYNNVVNKVYNIILYVHLSAGFVCYDDGCHLRKFARNPAHAGLTATTSKTAELEIVIDRMHFKGHVDSRCKQTCNPDNFSELNNVRIINN